MKLEIYRMTNKEITKCILLGRFKWYRKRKGGTWTLVKAFPYYWINREPFDFEFKLGEVFKVERY